MAVKDAAAQRIILESRNARIDQAQADLILLEIAALFGKLSMHDKPYAMEDERWGFTKPRVVESTTYHAHGRNVLVAFLDNGEVWNMVTGGVDPQWTRLPPIPGTV